jgi:hypothetical protein
LPINENTKVRKGKLDGPENGDPYILG